MAYLVCFTSHHFWHLTPFQSQSWQAEAQYVCYLYAVMQGQHKSRLVNLRGTIMTNKGTMQCNCWPICAVFSKARSLHPSPGDEMCMRLISPSLLCIQIVKWAQW
eukprot:167393-Pelagomonas_calceolata.AAC.3